MKIFNKIPETKPKTPLLDKVSVPSDIRSFSVSELEILSDELREFLLFSVGQTGGHLGGGLGVIELTVVLHHLYNTPYDNLVWDVGHQAYPHKILTGRKNKIHTVRQKEGLAPFPAISESEYDAFGVGHSSTSISAILGMAMGAQKNDSNKKHVAVIGDGAMTAGMAFEALSHSGHLKPNILVILNDNDMSISENIGGLSNYFSRIWASKIYKGIKKSGASALKPLPQAYHLARKVETQMKAMVAPGTIFEELGFNYVGPIDGHNIKEMTDVISNLKDFEGPQFLHVITKKGAGLDPAESDRIGFHAIGKINSIKSDSSPKPKYQDIFSDWIVGMAEKDESLVAITPAMREGSGLVDFSKKYPDRYFDVAIAEQHSVTFAAGLSLENKKPVVAIYSTFLQRAYDQFIHDVAVQNLDVTFALDRAGLVGEDGPTHSGNYDIAYLRCIPNIILMTPSDENETRLLLTTAFKHKGPAAVRYPRGTGPNASVNSDLEAVEIGKAKVVKESESNVVFLNFGALLDKALEVSEKMDFTLIDMRFVKPLDQEILKKYLSKADYFVSLEDGSIAGGAGSAVQEFCSIESIDIKSILLGIPDRFIEHSSREEMLESAGLSVAKILDRLKPLLGK
ncbi:MAG: 1-deoxy-D-xylulose-5-phosphate synthase [Proteobacteria bacterium]|jgi:1-deoxy-D-xylulose-5-phosphate synthase|nr:1-deoxy-D-xylulose-5-phosphate synthase [Pseudomonadota bacterium]NCV45404.1 1-deoxy-D-xylulose-5-phosphate synthase [Pseudomonadota bacterium]NCV99749.1 1-deoxy-D-xylulose-5-phosphate synthase [Pseudomonadota bacterium]NCW10469.1 1-deoxy-D-xylulose-5-phosphate synthase [Pseudomonadota bacterium]NCW37676.1 1-deoxy-D-xylulose-5-phosphate synthase [Pseudomonadota bacterium]|tara:strand:- start:775 stop:2649 length:1875 start_codon:yes stop_codon:yes gene_type:complete